MSPAHRASALTVALLLCAVLLGATNPAAAVLQKPTYAPGDRWVYVLEGSLPGFPGFNETQIGQFQFDLVGRVDVEVVGFQNLLRSGVSIPTIFVETRTTGFLNGTLFAPGIGTAQVTGTFGFLSTEFWEAEGYVPIEARGTTTYVAQVVSVVTADLVFIVHLNSTGSGPSVPPFELGAGENATASVQTRLEANATVTVLGQSRSLENNTEVSSIWRRELGSEESVRVEAGTFATHRFNQTLGPFPGIPGIAAGNETAYFSNDVGYYVKRVGYQDGEPVAEMRLRSYTYAAGPGLKTTTLLVLILVPVALILLAVFLVWRRRAARKAKRSISTGPPPSAGREGEGGHAR